MSFSKKCFGNKKVIRITSYNVCYTKLLRKNLPKNGWALHGMKLAYNNLGETDKAEAVDQQLAEVWATADTRISSSRIK